jgi:DNA polymerase V
MYMTVRVVTIAEYSPQKAVKRPLYASRPAAGFPAPGDDQVEQPLDLNDLLIEHKEATFFVRVEGDSMEGVGIFSGDVLVVDRAITPQSGDIVVAAVYGEMVVKRMVLHGKVAQLVSENEQYAPIVLGEAEDCHVWGVVVGSVRIFR